MEIGPGIPVLRVESMAAALPFYVDRLGFEVDWEHRFAPGLPLYVQVSRAQTVFHLSEHRGDGTPNSVVWIPVTDVYGLHKEFAEKAGGHLPHEIEPDSPGGPTFEVVDPTGNVLRFAQPQS
ncbi:glyoxalase superfamily protein [Actinoplanes sp. Pm04-4]|uniref:Bleomycin resistance protein n=1 Tax=Paractinoplanes pyxinae TaxID=2997416 RepID=A0ABT4BAZ3_9ACTN|nr:glyoxalase superfamily protein [Actinoplanes pyxinae]MCY1142770.1 glyoxalase superfamily protein [Actinoplanes pyxinae]